MSEIPSTVKAPIESDAGVIVVVGTAPVNMADDPYHATNVPLLVHTMAEAKSAVGYSTDFKNYTICDAVSASFQIVNVAPMIIINVLDPSKTEHTADVVERSMQVNDGSVKLETIGLLLDKLLVKADDVTLKNGTDYTAAFNDDGTVTFSLNRGNMPELTVSTSFTDMIDTYKKNKGNMSRQDKEALLYAKEKVDKAQGFIEAIRQRRHTLIVTMKAIIERQKAFFLDGDEADLKPMILKDIEERTGLDKSTISRVSNMKYAQTKWGTFPLKFFFTDSYTTEDGEEMSTRKIKLTLKELIEHEDKKKPLSDDALSKVLKEKGFPVARRTVAKYREQLGIPVARLRK